MPPGRSTWTNLTDDQLLAQCAVDTYRASGPGGQKRNKTDSAVRLRHLPSGMLAIAEESRSQHENKARALRRLRERLYLQLREPWQSPATQDGADATMGLRPKHPLFWSLAARVLDALETAQGQVSTAAELLGTSTGRLVDFLQRDAALWTQANLLRQRHGRKPLRSN